MNTLTLKRRLQLVCALFLHIPLVAIVAYAISAGFSQHLAILGVALVSTLAATILAVPYIGRAMDGALPTPAE
ncbi:hypothetical protein [Psychromarinibacter sp. S121]|uniref:hypothetical protein n=1 Tax=Psychromarinibacter sp. S121 TaxID=3415127 RepID=UPI003C7C9487